MIKSSQSALSTVPNNYVYNSNINYVNMQNFTFNNNNYGCYANNNNVNNQNESIETITEPQVEAYITNIQYQLGINQLSSYNFACVFKNLALMLKNKYATYVIENCMKALNEINSEEIRRIKLNILTVLIEFPNIKDKKKIYKYMKKFNQLNKQYVN